LLISIISGIKNKKLILPLILTIKGGEMDTNSKPGLNKIINILTKGTKQSLEEYMLFSLIEYDSIFLFFRFLRNLLLLLDRLKIKRLLNLKCVNF
jgi:hypothetical protein